MLLFDMVFGVVNYESDFILEKFLNLNSLVSCIIVIMVDSLILKMEHCFG